MIIVMTTHCKKDILASKKYLKCGQIYLIFLLIKLLQITCQINQPVFIIVPLSRNKCSKLQGKKRLPTEQGYFKLEISNSFNNHIFYFL